MYLVGLDVGTTNCKAVVFDEDGNIKGYGSQEYDIICENPKNAEQDPEQVWEVTKLVLAQAVQKSGVKDIKALSISTQGDAVIPVDAGIKPLHNALLGMDYRTVEQADYCAKLMGDRALYELTGMRPHPMNALTKILWFKQKRPGVYGKTYKFMTYEDFILAKLGAEPVIDFSMASRTMAFDLAGKNGPEQFWKKPVLIRSFSQKPCHPERLLERSMASLPKNLACQKASSLFREDTINAVQRWAPGS